MALRQKTRRAVRGRQLLLQPPVSVFRIEATRESIQLSDIFLKINGLENIPSLTGPVTLWDGNVKIGEAVFVAGNQFASSTLFVKPIIPAGESKIIVAKANFSEIGIAKTGRDGAFVKIDYSSARPWRGVGQNSGATISSIGSDTIASGTRIFKSYPVFEKLSLPASELTAGRRDLYRFKVRADNSGPVGIYKFSLNVSTSSALGSNSRLLDNLNVYAYNDSSFTSPASGVQNDGALMSVSQNLARFNGLSEVYAENNLGTRTILTVPTGQSMYFAVRGDVVPQGESIISTAILGDSAYPILSASSTMGTASVVDADTNDDFIWTPFGTTTAPNTTPNLTNNDFTNGYGVRGLPSGSMSQEVLVARGPVVPPVASSTIAVASSSLALSYDSAGGEVVLTAVFKVAVTAGATSPITLYTSPFSPYFINKDGQSAYANSYKVSTQIVSGTVTNGTDQNGNPTYVIATGQTVVFSVTTTQNPKEMFAGVYWAQLRGANSPTPNSIPSVSGNNTTNPVTIVGEVSPYIQSVSEVNTLDDIVVIKGVRFNKTSNTLTIGGKEVTGYPAQESNNFTTIIFTPRKFGIEAGSYSLFVTNPELGRVAGKSNVIQVQIKDGQVGVPVVSASLVSADEDRVGKWGQFGPNGNSDWKWTAKLNLPTQKTIESMLVTTFPGEGWSTSDKQVWGKQLYPLVVFKDGRQINTSYNTWPGTFSGGVEFTLYGQPGSPSFAGGGVITIYFTDGTSVSSNIPTSSIVPGISSTDLFIKNVSKADFHQYGFYVDVCMNGSKSINDIKRDNPLIKGFPMEIVVYDLNGNKYKTDASGGGHIEDLKNGQCMAENSSNGRGLGVTLQSNQHSAYDQTKKVAFMLDPNNLI